MTLVIIIFFQSQLPLYAFAFVILVLKLFVCLSFGVIYEVHLELFDSSFLNSSYGICNILSRLAVIAVPMLAEFESESTQLKILLVLNTLALISTLFLKRS